MRYQQRRRPDVTKDVVQLRPAPAALLRGVGSRRATEIYGLTLWVIIARFPGSLHGFESTLLSQLRANPGQIGYRSIQEFQVARSALAYDQKPVPDGRMAGGARVIVNSGAEASTLH